jgi:hypothetical protein
MYLTFMVHTTAILRSGVLVLIVVWVAYTSMIMVMGALQFQPKQETDMEDRYVSRSTRYLRWFRRKVKRN